MFQLVITLVADSKPINMVQVSFNTNLAKMLNIITIKIIIIIIIIIVIIIIIIIIVKMVWMRWMQWKNADTLQIWSHGSHTS